VIEPYYPNQTLISVFSHFQIHTFNEGKSSASFCHQMAALVIAMLCNFYLVKNHKIVQNSATTEAREKISPYLESLEFFDAYLTKFETKQIIHNNISHRFLASTKLFSG
jgi:hypothetical protein